MQVSMKFQDKLLGALLIVLLTCCASVKQGLSPGSLLNDWRHSYEEDQDEVRVFRPSSYNFPVGWNRERITINPRGEITLYEIAPNDAMIPSEGTWTLVENTLLVTFKDESRSPAQFDIVKHDSTILILKR